MGVRPTSLSFLLAIFAVLLLGCDSGGGSSGGRGRRGRTGGGRTSGAKATAATPEDDLDLAEEEPEEPFVIDETYSGRDPFLSYLKEFVKKPEEAMRGSVAPELRTPLENFSTGELKPIAIITGTPVPKAMLVDPSGLGHMVTQGTRVGREGGKIVRIAKNTIIIRRVDDDTGEVEDFPIKLHGDDEVGYQLNVVRHDFEGTVSESKESGGVLDGLDIDKILKESPADKEPSAAPASPGTAAKGAR